MSRSKTRWLVRRLWREGQKQNSAAERGAIHARGHGAHEAQAVPACQWRGEACVPSTNQPMTIKGIIQWLKDPFPGAAVVVPPRNPFGVCMADDTPEWFAGDRENLGSFMRSESGCRLRAAINFYEQGRNRRAVLSGDTQQIGRAAGFHEFGAWLLELSADVRPQQDEYSHLSLGAREVAERFAP